ncbi:MAG: epoxyqueuosine reductase [Oscillospiraceae bacterium]|nr:epoxyqueuosine reductase [Oscillospiraceae bacterium]
MLSSAAKYILNSKENFVSAEDALRPELAGMQIYDEPIFAVASADDPLFLQLREPKVVGAGAFLPSDWLDGAKSVISFFLPFTDAVKKSNRIDPVKASDEWLHARIEGQTAVDTLGAHICSLLKSEGFDAVYPSRDPRFTTIAPLTSNWSERHIAYICGLGTFGLSKGLITEKGMAGRFGSVVTTAELPVTPRPYSSPFEYCTMCKACQRKCPPQAIDASKGVADGKDHSICAPFVNSTKLPPHGINNRVRYGCGKCQVGVPCESRIPKK